MNTVVPQMKTGDMFLKKTTIILLHRSSRQDYLNTVTHLQEKKGPKYEMVTRQHTK